MSARSALLLLAALAACGGATAPGGKVAPVQIQFAFFHFSDDHVRVTVDGRNVFDRPLTVAPANARLGLAEVAQIQLPECSQIAVKSKHGEISERICLTAATKSIVVDGGPPLTISAKDYYQGDD